MSTAGKVLTVLIMLVMVVWLVMMSAVTQLNVNYGLKIKAQQEDLEKVTKDAEEANTAYLDTTEKARLEQDATDRDVRLKLTAISSAERRQSNVNESLSRVKLQLADAEHDAENAKKNLDNREAEVVKNEADIAKLKADIAKLQALNAELKTQLAQLQDDFKRLLAENAAKLKGTPAADSRPGPAS